MPIKDIMKRNEYRRRWYGKNADSEKAHVRKRKRKLGLWFLKYKKTLKCELCGEDHPATIDFHHKNGKDKDNGVSYFVYNGYSVKKIMKEIEKCQILCSNCHRRLHFENNKV